MTLNLQSHGRDRGLFFIAPMKQQHVVLAFVLGTIFGTLLPVGQVPRKLKRKTMAPFHISNVPETGVSHNPEIKKQVLASYLQLPHVTQV